MSTDVVAPKKMGTVGKRKSGKKKSKKPVFYINLTHCKYDILRTCIKEKGWVECSDDDGVDWVIFWTDTSVSPQRVMLLEKYQKINHFPGMLSIARKAQLAINLRRLQAIFPKTTADERERERESMRLLFPLPLMLPVLLP